MRAQRHNGPAQSCCGTNITTHTQKGNTPKACNYGHASRFRHKWHKVNRVSLERRGLSSSRSRNRRKRQKRLHLPLTAQPHTHVHVHSLAAPRWSAEGVYAFSPLECEEEEEEAMGRKNATKKPSYRNKN